MPGQSRFINMGTRPQNFCHGSHMTQRQNGDRGRGALSTARLFLTLPLSLSPTSASGAHLSPPTCDLLDQTFTQHTSSPALNPPLPSVLPLAAFSSTHSPLAAGSFLLEGVASWLNHNQAMTLPLSLCRPTPGWQITENKQSRDSGGVITRSETVFGKFFFCFFFS